MVPAPATRALRAWRLTLPEFSTKNVPGFSNVPDTLTDVYKEFFDAIQAAVTRIDSGALPYREFADETYTVIERYHAMAWRTGRLMAGESGALVQGDVEAGRSVADFDSQFLRSFESDLINGRYTDNETLMIRQVRRRADAYARKSRGTANEAFLTTLEINVPNVSIAWELGAGEHCPDCLDIAALSPYLPNELAYVPGGGSTVCMMECNCILRSSTGQIGPERLPSLVESRFPELYGVSV